MAALALWFITQSPFALLFAVLGPVTALASFADSRLGSRRSTKRELARFAEDAATTVAAIQASHDVQRSDLSELCPGAEAIVAHYGADPDRWIAGAASPILVRVGLGEVASSLRFDAPARSAPTLVDTELDEMQRLAATIVDAPVLVDARLGIGVCGPPVLAASLARAIVVQLAWALSPAGHWVSPDPTEQRWLDGLPHPRRLRHRQFPATEFGAIGGADVVALVAFARNQGELPGECRVVVRVGHGPAAEIVRHPDRAQRRVLRPGLVSGESTIGWAERVTAEAARDGLVSSAQEIPARLDLGPLLPPGAARASCESLPAVFAADAAGPVTIDLVVHGPHAVVGGTTGSGKSELLISWVLALAARHSPDDVNFLLLDFKGGSAFDSLAVLPHSVGIITDLDASEAARALASLRAELKHRERVLSAAGVRDIRGLPPGGEHSLPRLVIVADEFAAMLADHPDLHPLFADIASRGRSLGVHLVLCTQRPAGIVRDGVLANADLRISLRVNNHADSSVVVGTTAAAELPAHAVGRGLVGLAGAEPRLVQFAMAATADSTAVADRWRDAPAPRRPWCDPLPRSLLRLDLARQAHDGGTAGAFGLSDLPHEQRRGIARWDAGRDGHVLVLGTVRSGKSTALAAMASGGSLIPNDVPGAWDALADLDTAREAVVAIDDLDSLLARFPVDYRDVFVERLARVLRDGPSRGVHVVLAAQRLTAELNSLAALVPSRLMLRHANRADFVLAGGDGAAFEGSLPAGGGFWRGTRIQAIADPEPLAVPTARADAHPSSRRPWAVVTSRASTLTAQLTAAGLEVVALAGLVTGEGESTLRAGQVIVGEVEEWQSRWGLLPALRPAADVMFDRCTIADYRALTRSRELPPPLAPSSPLVWLETEEGVRRARLPPPRR